MIKFLNCQFKKAHITRAGNIILSMTVVQGLVPLLRSKKGFKYNEKADFSNPVFTPPNE
jgi:hypothetical protein